MTAGQSTWITPASVARRRFRRRTPHSNLNVHCSSKSSISLALAIALQEARAQLVEDQWG